MKRAVVYATFAVLLLESHLVAGIPKPPCDTNTFCDDGVCVLREWLCDGHQDCVDGEDEEQCGTTINPASVICNDEYPFHCSSLHCIPISKICDGVNDCESGVDEDCQTNSPTEPPPMATTIIILTVIILLLCGALFGFLVFMQQRRLIRIQRLQHQLTMQRRERQVQVVTSPNSSSARQNREEISPIM